MSQSGIANWPFPNIDITNSNVGQNEPSIAINPHDSLNIIVGANDDRDLNTLWAYNSTDGGLTWENNPLPIRFSWMLNSYATDPSIVFSPSGKAFYVNGHSAGFQNDVACFQSSNKGLAWSMLSDVFQDTSVNPDTLSDKFYAALDKNRSSHYYDRMYVTWVDQGVSAGYTRIVCSYSRDEGLSWSKRHYLSGLGHYTSPVPATEPDGTLLIAYVDYFRNNQILLARSSDGGATFSDSQSIASYVNLGPLLPDDSTGYENIGLPDSALAVNSFPSIAIDEFSGRAYVTWCGKGNDGKPHVWLSTSDDEGLSWKLPRAIDDDTVQHPSSKFFSWIAVDPVSRCVGVDYYVAVQDTVPPKRSGGTLLLSADLYLAHSKDSGASFVTKRISNASFDPITGQDVRLPENKELWFFGDYIGLVATGNTWYPAWTDSRNGDAEIYTAIVQPFAPMPVTNLTAHDTTVNGKPATVLSWQYVPQTTFGYPLPPGYQFAVAKDSSRLALQSGDRLIFVDTNGSVGQVYKITVISGGYVSAPDTVRNAKSDVAVWSMPNASVRFSNEPASAGREDKLIVEGSEDYRVTLTFFDELGREIGPATSDDIVSSHHELRFMLQEPGVCFFVLKESSLTNAREIVGKITVLQQ